MGLDIELLRERFATAHVARLATVTPDGRPHIVPVCFALRGRDVVSAIDAKPKSTTGLQRLANVRSNPVASLLVDHYEDDWTRLWWVRADGNAHVIEEGPERSAGIAQLRARYPQYEEQPPPGPVLVVRVTRWTGWSAIDRS